MRNNTPTPEQIAKLPKWAQAHIEHLTSERAYAVKRLDEYEDESTPSCVWQEEYCYDTKPNTLRKRYIQADRLEFEFHGVALTVNMVNDRGLELAWRPAGGRSAMGDLCFIPTSYQQARITNLAYDPHEIDRLIAAKERAERDRAARDAR